MLAEISKNEIILEIKNYVEKEFHNESSGHDWWHIYRVWKLAKEIAIKENTNLFVVELAALLHDIADWKFHDGNEKAGGDKAFEIMGKYNIEHEIVLQVVEIINSVSFKGSGVEGIPASLEGKIVQDADRLDALGAIGIARTFAYGGFKGRPMYNPEIKPVMHLTFEEYKKSNAPTINHFYEKLLLLKDRMNTSAGKLLAEERHRFMEIYLSHFFDEWNCNI